MDMDDTIYCDCYSDHHQLRLSYFKGYREGSITVFLKEHSFWKRLKLGIMYIFGYKCKYGHFEEFNFNKENAERFRDFTSRYLKEQKKFETELHKKKMKEMDF